VLRRAPRAPLFPYTTLFRSRSVREIERAEVRSVYWGRYWLPAGCEQLPLPLAFVVFDTAVNSGLHRALKWLEQTKDWREYLTVRDRKSTRLNSSHVKISYAV